MKRPFTHRKLDITSILWHGAASPVSALLPAMILTALAVACDGAASRDGVDMDDLPVLTAVEDLRIGDVSDPDIGFSRIAQATVDRRGNIYVLEGQERHVRVYDPAGVLLRVIGRQGEGPGEFGSVTYGGIKGDTLWVNDNQLRRVTLFDTAGQVIRTFTAGSLPPDVGQAGAFMMVTSSRLRDDGLLDSAFPPMVAYPVGGTMPDSMMAPQVRFDREGNVVDTTRIIPFYPGGNAKRITLAGKEVWSPAPPTDTPLRVPAGDELITVMRPTPVSAEDARITITRSGPAGDTLQHSVYRYRPQSFTSAFVDSLVARATVYAARTAEVDHATAESAMRAAIELPEFAPPISLASTGQDGTIWLRRSDDGSPTYRWIVLAPDGSARGMLDLSRSLTLLWMSGDVIVAVDRDELDIPWLVRLRIGGV